MEILNFMIGSIIILGAITASSIFFIDKYLNNPSEDSSPEK